MTINHFKLYARGIIFNADKALLLIRKNEQQKIGPGRWMTPGGTIEHGETPANALKRELLEEVNFRSTKLTEVGTETRILGNTHWLGVIFIAEGDVSGVKNNEPEKHSEMKWVRICDLPSYIIEKDFIDLVERLICSDS
ncbi:MAG: NUDIX hydrolase [Bdellovibrio sp.]|nr:NUDIX hydrolase [Bdellovibrio sp.]